MEDNIILEKLNLFGLTRQEAGIYLCLCQNGELTGYEVAKLTGISRSNVYSGLAGLADKGAAYQAEGNASKYVAVPVEEFCANKLRSLEEEKAYLVKHMPKCKEAEIGYITIEGYRNIRDKILYMIKSAKKRIYLSASSQFIEPLTEELEAVTEKNIKLVLITDREPDSEKVRQGSLCYLSESRDDNVRLIIDSQLALTGKLTGEKSDTCLYTGQEHFIQIFKDALRNEMLLIDLKKNGGKNE